MQVIKKIATIIMGIALCASLVFAAVSAPIKATLCRRDFYVERVVNDEFITALKSRISEAVYRQFLLYEVDSDKLISLISDEDLRSLSEDNIAVMVSYLLYGTEYSPTPYENPAIRAEIEADLTSFAEENELEVAEGIVDELYLAACNTVTLNSGIFAQSYLDLVPSFRQYIGIFDYWYIGVIGTVVLAAGIILLNHSRIKSALYTLFAFFWVGACLVFIPVVMLCIYNLPMRISMIDSPMKMFVDGAVYGGQEALLWSGGIVFAVACIGSVISIILNARRKKYVRHNQEREA